MIYFLAYMISAITTEVNTTIDLILKVRIPAISQLLRFMKNYTKLDTTLT